jgi:large subunit ribosomal protein L4
MDLQLYKTAKKIAVSDEIFARAFNEGLVHQTVVSYLAGGRAGTKAQKTRSQVRGGGCKPFKQKGSGRARAGTIRSPLWRGGGKTFAATPRDHSVKLNKKMYRAAMCSILSELLRQDRLLVVDDLMVTSPKTKTFVAKLNELGMTRGLILTETGDDNLYLSARNIPHIRVSDVSGASPAELVGAEKVLLTVGALRAFEERLS